MTDPQDIYLTGIVCMFLASKYLDLTPLVMRVVHDKIGHGEFSPATIKAKEREVFSTLDYILTLPTVVEFIEIDTMFLIVADYGKQKIKHILKLAVFLGKMACYDYKFSSYK